MTHIPVLTREVVEHLVWTPDGPMAVGSGARCRPSGQDAANPFAQVTDAIPGGIDDDIEGARVP